jgi:hypothetical protein
LRLAQLPSGISRRQIRRQKEEEALRMERIAPTPPEPTIRPQVLKSGARPMRDVILDPNPVLVRPRSRSRSRSRWQPSQKDLFKANIHPLHQVDIIMNPDEWDEVPDVRPSQIQDMDSSGRLYLSQPSMPILRSQVGKLVELSFLSRFFELPAGGWLRVGYRTQISDVLVNFKLNQNLLENVFLVDGPAKLRPSSVRMHYRVVPSDDLDLRLYLFPDFTALGLLDMSEGGMRFYHDSGWYFYRSRKLKLCLMTGPHKLVLDAKVVRNGTILDRYNRTRGTTSVILEEYDPRVRSQYLQLLTGVYRHLLAKRSGVLKEKKA